MATGGGSGHPSEGGGKGDGEYGGWVHQSVDWLRIMSNTLSAIGRNGLCQERMTLRMSRFPSGKIGIGFMMPDWSLAFRSRLDGCCGVMLRTGCGGGRNIPLRG